MRSRLPPSLKIPSSVSLSEGREVKKIKEGLRRVKKNKQKALTSLLQKHDSLEHNERKSKLIIKSSRVLRQPVETHSKHPRIDFALFVESRQSCEYFFWSGSGYSRQGK